MVSRFYGGWASGPWEPEKSFTRTGSSDCYNNSIPSSNSQRPRRTASHPLKWASKLLERAAASCLWAGRMQPGEDARVVDRDLGTADHLIPSQTTRRIEFLNQFQNRRQGFNSLRELVVDQATLQRLGDR